MSINFHEHAESRTLTQTVAGQGQRLRWTARGSTDQAAIRAALLLVAPLTWDDLTLVGFDATPYPGNGMWDCTADYAYSPEQAAGVKTVTVPGIDDPLGPEFEFDLTAKTAHITQSLRTVTSRFDNTHGGIGPPPAWATSTNYTVGQYVTNSGKVYVCVQAGLSDGSGSGPTGTGTGIADGAAKWSYLSSKVGGTVPVWVQATSYTSGQQVDSHGYLYKCATGGTSSAVSDGPVGSGTGIADGTCTWDYVSPDLDPLAPSYGQAIGVTRDRVVGTEIYVGSLEFSITAQYYPVTLGLLHTLLNLVGTFNRDEFYNFPTKTLLYLGCTGAPRPGDIWTLKHRFAASPNLRDVPVGANLTIPFKGGWDYLWAAYTDAAIDTPDGAFPVQRPFAAYVEQVLQAGNFNDLPI